MPTYEHTSKNSAPPRFTYYKQAGRIIAYVDVTDGYSRVSLGTACGDRGASFVRLEAPRISRWKERPFGTLSVVNGQAGGNAKLDPVWAGLDYEISHGAYVSIFSNSADDIEQLGELMSDLGPQLIAHARQLKRDGGQDPVS